MIVNMIKVLLPLKGSLFCSSNNKSSLSQRENSVLSSSLSKIQLLQAGRQTEGKGERQRI